MRLILALIMLNASGNYLLLCSLTSSSVTTSGFDGSYTSALGFSDSRAGIRGPKRFSDLVLLGLLGSVVIIMDG